MRCLADHADALHHLTDSIAKMREDRVDSVTSRRLYIARHSRLRGMSLIQSMDLDRRVS